MRAESGKRILMVVPSGRGGVYTVVDAIARVLRSSGHRVDVACQDFGVSRTAARFNLDRMPPYPGQDYDVVWFHARAIACAANCRIRATFIAHWHGFDACVAAAARTDVGRGHLAALPGLVMASRDAELVARGAAACTRNVAVSQGVRDEVVAHLGCECSVLPNWFVTSAKRREPSQDRGSGRELRIVVVGGRGWRKGLWVMMQACGQRDGRPFRVTVFDGGKVRDVRLGASVVAFRGLTAHASLLREMEMADVYLSSSLYEGMSLGLVDAVAIGLPVVVSNVNGVQEAVDRNGWVVPVGDVGALKRVLGSVATWDRQRLFALGRREMPQVDVVGEVGALLR